MYRSMMVLFLLNFSIKGKSQIFLDENRYIKPIGFSVHGFSTYYLKGGGSPYLEYKEPEIPLTLPTELPFKNIIPYQDLLFSGLQSLFFEYKNYQGQNDLSAYTVFALGNFRMLEDKVLIFLNKYIMNNQKLLQDIYKWAKPYYEKVFKELTIEEQKVIMQHVDVGEKYVLFVLKEKNKVKYQKWLADSKIQPDIKITGFIQRRISKKQWTIEDCLYWINLLKKDISPLIKNDQNPASHFQIVKIINKQLLITTNHKGEYFIMDNHFKAINREPYVFIEEKDIIFLWCYKDCYSHDYDVYSVFDDGRCIQVR